MSKNSNMGMMRKAVLSLLALGSLFSPGMGKASSHNTIINRDAVKQDVSTPSKKVAEKRVSGDRTYSGSGKRSDLNQRQYRKRVRRNPHIRNSKKFRGKN